MKKEESGRSGRSESAWQEKTMRPTEVSDLILVERAQRGDTTAFDELVERYQDSLFRVARRMCGEVEAAEDILQETFVKAYLNLDRFRGEAKWSTWLYRIAYNECLMRRRREPNQPVDSLDEVLETAEGEVHREIADWSVNPEEVVLQEELRVVLDEAIAALPEDYRLVFLLRDVEGFSAKEVQETTGLTLPTIKARLHRARLFLRGRLSEYFRGR